MTFGEEGRNGTRISDVATVQKTIDTFTSHGHTELDTARMCTLCGSHRHIGFRSDRDHDPQMPRGPLRSFCRPSIFTVLLSTPSAIRSTRGITSRPSSEPRSKHRSRPSTATKSESSIYMLLIERHRSSTRSGSAINCTGKASLRFWEVSTFFAAMVGEDSDGLSQ